MEQNLSAVICQMHLAVASVPKEERCSGSPERHLALVQMAIKMANHPNCSLPRLPSSLSHPSWLHHHDLPGPHITTSLPGTWRQSLPSHRGLSIEQGSTTESLGELQCGLSPLSTCIATSVRWETSPSDDRREWDGLSQDLLV